MKRKIEKIIRLLRVSRQTYYELIEQQKSQLSELQARNKESRDKQQSYSIKREQAESFLLPNETIPLKLKVVWIAQPSGFFFAEKQGMLRNNEGMEIQLKNSSLRLFLAFINAEDHKLSYEDICINVLARSIRNGADLSDRESVSTTIYRLKKCLKPFPSIQINSLRDFGYQMIYSNCYSNDI